MIRMPQRSVTRFFIPLIDVLLLLFVIFLLMPLSSEEELQRNQESSKNLVEDVESLEREIQALRDQLQRYRALEPKLKELEDLQARLEQLEKASRKGIQERVAFHVVYVDDKNGSLFMVDSSGARVPIEDGATARATIEKQKRESPGREPYYFFLIGPDARITDTQGLNYRSWFGAVANSLKEGSP